jgi:hypothetical protein
LRDKARQHSAGHDDKYHDDEHELGSLSGGIGQMDDVLRRKDERKGRSCPDDDRGARLDDLRAAEGITDVVAADSRLDSHARTPHREEGIA